ncbi:MAG: hypothetical protein WA484_13260 [Solirubrobacteraceae bacterium]
MKKIQILMLALAAVCALGLTIVAAASAETTITATLLAQWLFNTTEFAGSLASETKGKILLENTKLKVAVECTGSLVGTVSGANGEDEIKEVLNAALEKVGGGLGELALSCTTVSGCEAAAPIEVWPVNLPWKTLLELVVLSDAKEEFYDLILLGNGGLKAGYELQCRIILLTTGETCLSPEGSGGEVLNVAGGVEGAEAAFLPLATCGTSVETGVNEPKKGNLTTVSGGTLEVSST